MAKIKNTNFFKTGINTTAPVSETCQEKHNPQAVVSGNPQQDMPSNAVHQKHGDDHKTVVPRKVQLSSQLLQTVKAACAKLNGAGFPALANDMAGLYRLAINKRFTVAFVGEFSRGKSTLINRILGRDPSNRKSTDHSGFYKNCVWLQNQYDSLWQRWQKD